MGTDDDIGALTGRAGGLETVTDVAEVDFLDGDGDAVLFAECLGERQ